MQNQNDSVRDLRLKVAYKLSQLICHEHFVPMYGRKCSYCEDFNTNNAVGNKKRVLRVFNDFLISTTNGSEPEKTIKIIDDPKSSVNTFNDTPT